MSCVRLCSLVECELLSVVARSISKDRGIHGARGWVVILVRHGVPLIECLRRGRKFEHINRTLRLPFFVALELGSIRVLPPLDLAVNALFVWLVVPAGYHAEGVPEARLCRRRSTLERPAEPER